MAGTQRDTPGEISGHYLNILSDTYSGTKKRQVHAVVYSA